MPGLRQQQQESPTDYSAEHGYNNHPSHQIHIHTFAYNEYYLQYYSSTLFTTLEVPHLDLMTLQAMYFPRLSDFGWSELSPGRPTQDEAMARQFEAAEIMASMSEVNNPNENPNGLFAQSRNTHGERVRVRNDNNEQPYLLIKR